MGIVLSHALPLLPALQSLPWIVIMGCGEMCEKRKIKPIIANNHLLLGEHLKWNNKINRSLLAISHISERNHPPIEWWNMLHRVLCILVGFIASKQNRKKNNWNISPNHLFFILPPLSLLVCPFLWYLVCAYLTTPNVFGVRCFGNDWVIFLVAQLTLQEC